MDQKAIDAGIISGTLTILNAIVRIMSERGLLDKETFRRSLLDVAQEAPTLPNAPDFPRTDLLILDGLAKLLEDEEPPAAWRPTIIVGGKSP